MANCHGNLQSLIDGNRVSNYLSGGRRVGLLQNLRYHSFGLADQPQKDVLRFDRGRTQAAGLRPREEQRSPGGFGVPFEHQLSPAIVEASKTVTMNKKFAAAVAASVVLLVAAAWYFHGRQPQAGQPVARAVPQPAAPSASGDFSRSLLDQM